MPQPAASWAWTSRPCGPKKAEVAEKHLANSKAVFLRLVEKVRTFPKDLEEQCVRDRDYETLELAVLDHLMGT